MLKMKRNTKADIPPQIGEAHSAEAIANHYLLRCGAFVILLGALFAAPYGSIAAGQTPSGSVQGAPFSLQTSLEQAHALEVRGNLALASHSWQQVLLADPNNLEALGGLARAAKASRNLPLASLYLERLYAVRPVQAAPPPVAAMLPREDNALALQQAGKLAQQGEYAQATRLYRQVYADHAPEGAAALLFYETEAATEDGRPHAIAALRALAEKNPNDLRDRVTLARILTYTPATRVEGRKLLATLPTDVQALASLRQSLLWDALDPAASGEIRSYLAHHSDAQLSRALQSQTEATVSPRIVRPSAIRHEHGPAASVEIVPTTESQAADRAFAENHVVEAEQRFKAILKATPNDAHALLGMGQIRMQQSNFSGALSFFLQSKEADATQAGIEVAIRGARFQSALGQAASEYKQNHLLVAETQYRAALAIQPLSSAGLEGLGDVLLKSQQTRAAAACFTSLIKVEPLALQAWRGLFLAEANGGDALQALQTERRLPQAVRSELVKDPLFLRALSSAHASVGHKIEAQQTLGRALDLPYPVEAKNLQKETRLQYANLLQQTAHLDQAAALYRQVLAADQNDAAAWQGLIRAEHAMKLDQQALETIKSMPSATRAQMEHDPVFLETVTSIYSALGHPGHANRVPQLSQPLSFEPAGSSQPSSPLGPIRPIEPFVRPAFYVSPPHPILSPAMFREPQALRLTQQPQGAETKRNASASQSANTHRAQPLTTQPASDLASGQTPAPVAPIAEEIYGPYVPYQAPSKAPDRALPPPQLPLASALKTATSLSSHPLSSHPAKASLTARVLPTASVISGTKIKSAIAVGPVVKVVLQSPTSSRFGESKPPIEDYNTPLPEALQPLESQHLRAQSPVPR